MSTYSDRDLDGMTRAELVQVIRDQRAEVEQLREALRLAAEIHSDIAEIAREVLDGAVRG